MSFVGFLTIQKVVVWDFGTINQISTGAFVQVPSTIQVPSTKARMASPKYGKEGWKLDGNHLNYRSQKNMHQQNRKALESTALSVSLYLFPNLETLHVNRPFKKMAVPQRLSFIDRWYIHTFNPGIFFCVTLPTLPNPSSSNYYYEAVLDDQIQTTKTPSIQTPKTNIWRKSTHEIWSWKFLNIA